MNSAAVTYLSSPWNHLRAVRAWAAENGAHTSIDASSYRIEIRAHNRYFTLHPKFYARTDAGWCYVADVAAENVCGFAGWLPYRTVQWPLSSDKRAFDAFARRAGLRRPAVWAEDAEPDDWYLVKAARGSFGDQVAGPFSPRSPRSPRPPLGDETFREAYVPGRALKVWFWGARPFFAQLEERPEVVGDGARSVLELLPASDVQRTGDDATLSACLAFQGLEPHAVLPAGKRAWIDFRYGRRIAPRADTTVSDDVLPSLHTLAREQVDRLGAALWTELEPMFGVPMLCSADGVLDADHQVWWLEVNSNPTLPPDGYPLVLGTLFPPAPRAAEVPA